MSIKTKDLQNISYLAKINIQEKDFPHLERDLKRILDLIKKMDDADTSGVKALSHPLDVSQPLRKDEVTEIDESEKYLSLAPLVNFGHFLVPKVIDDGE